MTNEDLQQIERHAGNFLSPEQIGIIMGIDASEILQPKSEANLAYQKGKLIKVSEFRTVVIKMATEGSSAAQVMVDNWIKQQQENELSIR